MRQIFLALLAVLCCQCVQSATVRPYKFGFTIEEQQHRAEQRDENGIVMGEFGFITADGIYHVTVYATDENGKFRIISMKNFPYAGPVAPKTPAVATTTPRTTPAPPPKHNFNTVACSGCFLNKSPPEPNRSTKNEIRPLSQPLSPAAAAQPGQQPLGAAGNGIAAQPALTATKKQPQQGQQPSAAGAAANFKPAAGNTIASSRPVVTATQQQQQQPAGGSSASFPTGGFAGLPAGTATKQPQSQQSPSGGSSYTPQTTKVNQGSSAQTATQSGAGAADLTGDLYKFKYLLDFNGHEETGSRNGNKKGNYFAIGDDAIARTVEYIANEFGFQPHISWRKLEGNEAVLPDENTLKHYEFKWFNTEAQ